VNYAQLYVALQSYTQNYESSFISNIPTFVRQAEKRIYNSVQLAYLRKSLRGTLTANNKYLSTPSDFLSTYSLAIYPTQTTTATGSSAAFTITVGSNSGIAVGYSVSGTGIGQNAKVTVINGTTITLSVANSAAVSGSVTFQGDYIYLLDKDVNFLRAAYSDPNYVGTPSYYALFGPTTSSGTLTNELSYILAPAPDQAYGVEIHYYYYPASIVAGVITALSSVTPGAGYTDGVYYNVPLSGGAGTGATATIIVVGSEVVTCTIENPGSLYLVNDALTADQAYIGGGTLFSVVVTAINNSTGTSWLGDSYDAALLYGSLVEAYGYMKGEQDIMQYYELKYEEALKQLRRLGDGLERGDAYRDGQVKLPVTT
jgi:hypothetical protein